MAVRARSLVYPVHWEGPSRRSTVISTPGGATLRTGLILSLQPPAHLLGGAEPHETWIIAEP